ncbi:MAG: SRPBCC family protein [Fermentimonas sp.]|jgi:carbon monoxide dehydrogenase subunit G
MTEYVSEVKRIPHGNATVFGVLSNLQNLERVKEWLPMDGIGDFTFDGDAVSFRLNPVGEVTFRLVERQPNKLLKFQAERLPLPVFLWIQLVGKSETDTRLRVTVRADVNPLTKGMVDKPLREVVEKLSDGLSKLPYDRL